MTNTKVNKTLGINKFIKRSNARIKMEFGVFDSTSFGSWSDVKSTRDSRLGVSTLGCIVRMNGNLDAVKCMHRENLELLKLMPRLPLA